MLVKGLVPMPLGIHWSSFRTPGGSRRRQKLQASCECRTESPRVERRTQLGEEAGPEVIRQMQIKEEEEQGGRQRQNQRH